MSDKVKIRNEDGTYSEGTPTGHSKVADDPIYGKDTTLVRVDVPDHGGTGWYAEPDVLPIGT